MFAVDWELETLIEALASIARANSEAAG